MERQPSQLKGVLVSRFDSRPCRPSGVVHVGHRPGHNVLGGADMIRNHPQTSWVLVTMVLGFCLVSQAQTPAIRPAEAPDSSRASSSGTSRRIVPESVGLSSERLERISRNIQKSVEEHRIAGAVSLVARHGKIAYLKAFGMANREDKKPMQ